jgi:hypothetical protein
MLLMSLVVASALAVPAPQDPAPAGQAAGQATPARVVGIGGGGERWIERRKAWRAFAADLGEPTRTFLTALEWLDRQAPETGLWVPEAAPGARAASRCSPCPAWARRRSTASTSWR